MSLLPFPQISIGLGVFGLLASGACAIQTARMHAAHQQIATIKAQTKLAAKEAEEKQARINSAPAQISTQIASQSNENSKVYYEKGRAAGIAYADAHRVRQPAIECPVSTTDVRSTDQTPLVNDRPGITPDMVALSQGDYDILVSNSLRLAQVHIDAEALIGAGIAVK